ncbi:MAG: HD domain-containing protein [Deltaproteobacteria bacterium]|nr:MAG: HD domain-containing protein [Deltaproteobacteria bacterium]
MPTTRSRRKPSPPDAALAPPPHTPADPVTAPPFALPEELQRVRGSVRIPELRNVPLTDRVAEIIDHPAFQRLRMVRQLGPTCLVYPGAVHTRFEHSLGVFDLARQYLLALLRFPEVAESLTRDDLVTALLGALLHDLGHYPFAHSLEALHHKGRDTPRHEDLSGRILRGEIPALRGERPIADIIRDRFGIDPEEVIALITRSSRSHERAERRLVASVLSSGIDADKSDYLERDSIHMGVSYGRNYDRARLLESLCPNLDGDRIAVTAKGRVSCEMFVFCRYTMFSEAYWHHTVRSVSAMMERAMADIHEREAPDTEDLAREMLARSDDALLDWFLDRAPEGSPTARLLARFRTGQRHLHKRLLTLSRVVADERRVTAYERIYHLDRSAFLALEELLRDRVSAWIGAPVAAEDLLIDTPPRDKDRIETVDVVYDTPEGRRSYRLEEQSKVVQGIATDFIKVVKKIRVFAAPAVRDALRRHRSDDEVREGLLDCILAFTPTPTPQQSLL